MSSMAAAVAEEGGEGDQSWEGCERESPYLCVCARAYVCARARMRARARTCECWFVCAARHTHKHTHTHDCACVRARVRAYLRVWRVMERAMSLGAGTENERSVVPLLVRCQRGD